MLQDEEEKDREKIANVLATVLGTKTVETVHQQSQKDDDSDGDSEGDEIDEIILEPSIFTGEDKKGDFRWEIEQIKDGTVNKTLWIYNDNVEDRNSAKRRFWKCSNKTL